MELFPKLIKILKEEHLTDLLDGNLFLKTALFYRKNYDEGEAIFKNFSNGHKVKFSYGDNFENDILLTINSANQIINHSPEIDGTPILCVSIFQPFDDENQFDEFDKNKKQPIINQLMSKYGNCCVLINYEIFLERLIKEASLQNKNIIYGPVYYYDKNIYQDFTNKHKELKELGCLYYKSKERHSFEKEFRIAIYDEIKKRDESIDYRFNIGNMKDICYVYTFEEFVDQYYYHYDKTTGKWGVRIEAQDIIPEIDQYKKHILS